MFLLFVLSLNLFSFSLQNNLSDISELFQEQEFAIYDIQKQFVKIKQLLKEQDEGVAN